MKVTLFMLEIIPLFSGSSGNSSYVRYGSTELLIDAGVSCRTLSLALEKIGTALENISCVLVTHEHIDHIRGLETICKKREIPVYINSASANIIKQGGKNPFLCKCLKILEPGSDIMLSAEISVHAFKTPHDSGGSVGYRINAGDSETGDSFSYVTDIGYVTRDIARNIFGSKTIIFESNHDVEMLKNGDYPEYLKSRIMSDHGHLSNDACAKFIPYLASNGTQKIILAHLSKENNTAEKAFSSASEALRSAGYEKICLEIAPGSILDNET